MAEVGYLSEIIVVLFGALVSALLFQKLGLGTVLGYLVAGAVIGPSALGLVSHGETVQALAELGVVFLLFTVGLEMPPERIKVLFGRILGLGLAQVVVTAAAFAGVAWLLGMGAAAALTLGTALALSSTALVLKWLSERRQLTSQFGRTVFGIVVVQDLAVGPLLVCVLALGQEGLELAGSLALAFFKMAIAVLLVVVLGRIVLVQIFRQVAAVREPEIFAALTLFIVLLAGLATRMAGLSVAFGAFLAGMLLAATVYRHQVGAEIQPFRGLLLGMFFISVGMAVDPSLVVANAGTVLGLALAIILGKAVILIVLCRLLALPTGQSVQVGVLLSQAGEFSFVLLGAALAAGVLADQQAQVLVVAVAMTMIATPLLAPLAAWLRKRMEQRVAPTAEEISDQATAFAGHVVIAGYGRVGAAVGAKLKRAGVPYIAVDMDAENVARARRQGLPVYFGDATRPDLLDAVNVERARALVVALDDPRAALQLVALVRYIFPDLLIHARARDNHHADELERAGANVVVPELVATGVRIADSIVAPGGA